MENKETKQRKRNINYTNMTVAIIALVVLIFSGGFVGWEMYVKSKYPLEYAETIVTYSKEFELDPFLVASVICRESKFKPKAKSRVGAKGLMQIMPETGEWVAKKMDIAYSEDDLYKPDRNIRMGCWYLNYLLKKYKGSKNEALAAYNAGQGKVDEWLKDKNYSDDKKTLKTIPYEETKNYVEAVNSNYEKYKKYYSKELS